VGVAINLYGAIDSQAQAHNLSLYKRGREEREKRKRKGEKNVR